MDLAQKIGQLLIVGIPGAETSPEDLARLQKWHVGGIILFTRNLINPNQTRQLTSALNEALSNDSPPLWFCIDQEGGIVIRMSQGVSVFPGNMALGAADDPELAYQVGKQTALDWVSLGVNVNLAPVLDLCYPENPGIGVRSLGGNAQKVSLLGEKLIAGMQDHAMWATAKHFPGKGLARLDSHLDLPVIEAPMNELEQKEFIPFEKAIQKGVRFVMSSHCVYKAIDPENPATLSKKILHGLLREKMGFDGLVISDDLEMGAIVKNTTVEEAALAFVQAGGDQVLVCHTPEQQEKVFNRLLRAAKTGELSEKDLNLKVERILKHKKEWAAQKSKADFSKNGDKSISAEVGRKSITVLKNEKGLIPLALKEEDRLLVLCVDYTPLTQVEEDSGEKDSLEELLTQAHRNTELVKVPLDAVASRIPELAQKGNEADFVLIFTYNAHMNPSQAGLIRKLSAGSKPLVVCALRNPFDIQAFPEVGHYVACYGFRAVTLKALIDVLFGRLQARGVLPVEIALS